MRVSIIAAMASNRTIGIDNRLPWNLPEDLKHFRQLTMGHHILMGRKTWESIGKPLPGRSSVIITRSQDYQVPGCRTANSIPEAIAACGDDGEVFFIGGADLYLQALAVAQRVYLTEIQRDFDGDAHFPALDPATWREVTRTRHQSAGEQALPFHFVMYERIATGADPWKEF